MKFATLCAICNTWSNLQCLVKFLTLCAICNTWCNLQDVKYATHAICNTLKNTPIYTLEVKRVVPHLRGERGWVSHSSGSLERGCLSSAEVIKNTEEFIQFQGLILSVFWSWEISVFEWFLYLRDFFYHFDRFLELFKRDFLNKVSEISQIKVWELQTMWKM